ncbi:hypothetical protein EV421DRAFT_1789356 [Armillaria borealis]|uniref:F-box domain-containing protein n=1 Tax=Armillaria borealis TaxID=47425 RepID=A0AA39MUL1_9AGAR|nr:hypothetical protein EV421DRAFT_1789356 [Armillaria borealis]
MESTTSLSSCCYIPPAHDDPPILRVMPEILTSIFTWVRIANGYFSGATPWILSQVCRRWRDIALSYPEMWSCVNMGGPRTINISGRVHQLEVSLFRSRSYPLRIWYREDGDPNAHLWYVLLDHCDHWRTIEITVATADFIHRLFKPQRHALTLLEQFHLYSASEVSFNGVPEFNESVLDALATAPRLHDILADHFRSPSSLHLPWSQLTKIHFMCGSPQDDIDILLKTPNLQQLYPLDHTHNLSLPAPINHTSLRELRAPEVNALSRFTFPAFKTLSTKMTLMEGNTPSRSPIVHEFIVRSRCTLREMELMSVDTDQSLIDLLKDTPTVEVLSLSLNLSRLPSALDTLSKSLTYPETDKPIFDTLLPHLAKLSIGSVTCFPINHAFATMVRSRWYVDPTRATQLRRLVCYVCTIESDVDAELLRRVYGEGLQLYIRMPGSAAIGSSFDH